MSGESRLDDLTPAQAEGMAETATRWALLGLATRRADRARAERAVATIYRTAGRRPPARIVWCGSPLSMEAARALALGTLPLAAEWGVPLPVMADARRAADAVRGIRPGAALADALRQSLLAPVAVAVRECVGEGVHLRVTADVRKAVERRVDVPVGFPVADSLESALGGPPGPSLYGQHEAGWLSYYGFFHGHTALRRATARLRGLWELAASASWAAPHEHVCWISERPLHMERDGKGRLHCDLAAALRFADGWEIRARRGIVVPSAAPARIAS
jgi:hypothetical protein